MPGDPAAWERAGFTLVDGAIPLGGVRIVPGSGEPGWSFGAPDAPPVEHPNGATAIDHVVLLTDDFDATVERLRDEGLDYRRTREAGNVRQAFFVLGPCLLEVAGPIEGGERLWGVTLIAADLEPFGGRIKDAVQPGRKITTVPREAGLDFPVAVMTPR